MLLVGYLPVRLQGFYGCGSISSEAILVFPKDVVDFGFYAVS